MSLNHALRILSGACFLLSVEGASGRRVALQAPESAPRYDPAEFVIRVNPPPGGNPFTDLELTGVFTPSGGEPIRVSGFCDSPDGRVFRLRFCPERVGPYRYRLRLQGGGLDRRFEGVFRSRPSSRPGPVIVDPRRPRHFVRAGSGEPFYHLGYTAYHLLDPSNDDAQVEATIRRCARMGFNKIRFLLTGYPRDLGRKAGSAAASETPDPWKAPNYGARPGQVNPLPAWEGKPHAYDFTRFNAAYWRRVDRAVRLMRRFGIVATCIFTIEKQNLPKEYGRLTEHEYRLYRYAIARLAAFDNVWWDLGNEHNEYRDKAWGDIMGGFVKAADPYDRLASAHGYADFWYADSKWADFIITQQYGDEQAVHDWARRYAAAQKPYVNEEYGYEGNANKPGHGQNADWVRRCHWSVAMAGGYATYGDWSGGVSYFYMGEPGPGKAAPQLGRLRAFFEGLPFAEMEVCDECARAGFCLARPPKRWVFYFPRGGESELDLTKARGLRLKARWFDPRTGRRRSGPALRPGRVKVRTPTADDWALTVEAEDD